VLLLLPSLSAALHINRNANGNALRRVDAGDRVFLHIAMASEQLQQRATIFLGMQGGGTIETIFRLASALLALMAPSFSSAALGK